MGKVWNLKGIRIWHLKINHFDIRFLFSWRHLSFWNPLSALKQSLPRELSCHKSPALKQVLETEGAERTLWPPHSPLKQVTRPSWERCPLSTLRKAASCLQRWRQRDAQRNLKEWPLLFVPHHLLPFSTFSSYPLSCHGVPWLSTLH